MLYDGCVGVATCRSLLFTSADNYRHLVFNYPRIIARRPRRLRTAAGDGSGARSEYRYNAAETLGIINIARVIASADIRTIIMCNVSVI